jgi:hypothetical protein
MCRLRRPEPGREMARWLPAGRASINVATISWGSSESGITCRIASSVTATGRVKSKSSAARLRIVPVSCKSASM